MANPNSLMKKTLVPLSSSESEHTQLWVLHSVLDLILYADV